MKVRLVFHDDINPLLPEASLEMPWFVLRQRLIVDLTFSPQWVRSISNSFIRCICPITCCMCVKRPRISQASWSDSLQRSFNRASRRLKLLATLLFVQPPFKLLTNSLSISAWLFFTFQWGWGGGGVTAMACEFSSKWVPNARHSVVFVSDKILISFSGILMNYKMDAPTISKSLQLS